MKTSNIINASAILVSLTLFAHFATTASAQTYQISGNGAGSGSTLQVTGTSSNVVSQQNSANVNNNVNSNADTGGNSINGNTGGEGSITTGNATVNTNICNSLNTNIVGNGGAVNNPCITPTKVVTSTSTATPTPQAGGTRVDSAASSTGSSSSDPGVAGLTNTSGENSLLDLIKLLPALAFLTVGSKLLRKNA